MNGQLYVYRRVFTWLLYFYSRRKSNTSLSPTVSPAYLDTQAAPDVALTKQCFVIFTSISNSLIYFFKKNVQQIGIPLMGRTRGISNHGFITSSAAVIPPSIIKHGFNKSCFMLLNCRSLFYDASLYLYLFKFFISDI